jgi:phosphatidate cytidylyltransferase
LNLDTTIIWPAVWVAATLAFGSLMRMWTLRRVPASDRRDPLGRLIVWWCLLALVAVALLLGSAGIATLLCVCSLLAVREFTQMIARTSSIQPPLSLVALFTLVHYFVLWMAGDSPMRQQWLTAVPVILLGILCVGRIVRDRVEHFLSGPVALFWGSICFVYGLSFALFSYVEHWPPDGRRWGPLVLLLILTECNDIFQSLVGRQIGKHPLLPNISPKKTWEGLVGGLVGTLGLSLLLVPWLIGSGESAWEPSRFLGTSLAIGVTIVLSGLAGDLNMSLIKRNYQLKDSGNLLPGMGGIVDRLDSLSFSAPAFYYLMLYLGPNA